MRQTKARKTRGSGLHTLTEVARIVGISMPTVQRYKNLYQERIPSVGEGRKQRYPKEALAVFSELKKENAGRRGRPRKNPAGLAASASGSKAGKGGASAAAKLLTLTEIGQRTGISYPTLIRYVQTHGREIPHQGRGRKRRFPPEAVEVFQRLRSESRPGRKPKAGAAANLLAALPAGSGASERRVAKLEKSVAKLEKTLKRLLAKLRKPRRLV